MKSFLPSSTSPILTNLLSVLSENGRLASAPKVFADFNTLMAAYRGELEVIVTSAETLDSKALSRLEKALKGTEVAQGKTLKISNRVSRCLIGSHITKREIGSGFGLSRMWRTGTIGDCIIWKIRRKLITSGQPRSHWWSPCGLRRQVK